MPADGVVIDGHSSVSEALLTGEARPISKAPGAVVVGGSLNQSSPLIVRVDRLGTDTRLAAIVRLLDRAQSEKPHLARLADRAAAWFVSVLLVISALVAAAWYVIDPTQVLWITVSILVVTCPCALGLATPRRAHHRDRAADAARAAHHARARARNARARERHRV